MNWRKSPVFVRASGASLSTVLPPADVRRLKGHRASMGVRETHGVAVMDCLKDGLGHGAVPRRERILKSGHPGLSNHTQAKVGLTIPGSGNLGI
jgi:hypothetical protein